jgi:hypothetical protein
MKRIGTISIACVLAWCVIDLVHDRSIDLSTFHSGCGLCQ